MSAMERGPQVWETDAWRASATAWIDDALRRHGRSRTGPVEQPRIRPWGTVLRAATAEGFVWLKAGADGTAVEAALYEVLARVTPDAILVPLAVDAPRGWVLLPDGGPSLHEATEGEELLDGLTAALPSYAALQLAMAATADELVALGVTDMRPAALPERFEQALAATEPYAHRRGAPDDADLHARIAERRGDVARLADQLAAAPVSPSLDHNDLHAGNVLLAADGTGARFYDWGDSVVAHPFVSMLTTLTSIRDFTLGCADEDPRLLRLRDAYLQPFAEAEGRSVDELVPALELACRLGKIARTLTWQRAIDAAGPQGPPPEWERAPFATLASLLDDSPYGGA